VRRGGRPRPGRAATDRRDVREFFVAVGGGMGVQFSRGARRDPFVTTFYCTCSGISVALSRSSGSMFVKKLV
jgi:hypothetical protein